MAFIRIVARPAGATCNHVHINDVNGVRQLVTTIAELRNPVTAGEQHLLAQIKRMARESGLNDMAALKTYLETKDFDL